MLKIILLRHGMTEGNSRGKYIGSTDEPLLEEEYQALADHAAGPVQAVFVSPMKRCVQTAKALFPSGKITIIPELKECDFGLFENKTYQELMELPVYREWSENRQAEGYPEGETLEEFRNRCLEGFERVMKIAKWKGLTEIALIVHSGTIMSVLGAYAVPKRDYSEWHVGNAEGYILRCTPENFLHGMKELVVDSRILRFDDAGNGE